MRIDIKPLSVNEAWQGKRYKTKAYKTYEKYLLYALKKGLEIPEGKLEIYLKFGFATAASDCNNPEKMFIDILSKKYGFNDNRIYRSIIEKNVVGKGNEYIEFEIREYK